MKNFLLIACIGLFLAGSSSAYSPPEKLNLQTTSLSVDDEIAPLSSFAITANAYDVGDVIVLQSVQAPVVCVAVNATSFQFASSGIKNSNLYVLKPPLRYLNRYAFYNSSPAFKSPFSIQLRLHHKRC